MSSPSGEARRCFAAELLGTYLLVFFGCGAVHSAVLTGSLHGLWQVAVVWGISIMIAAHAVGWISGAHINPAVTVALAAWQRFPWSRVGYYVLAQLCGAFLAAATLYGIFSAQLAEKERVKRVERGELGSVVTAMCYGEYYPNPGPLAEGDEPFSATRYREMMRLVSLPSAFMAEAVGTAVLALMVMAVSDPRWAREARHIGPGLVGLTVAGLICVLAPLTQACLNPARDLGPRVFAYLAGWKGVAIPGPQGSGFAVVYVLGPLLGGLVGAGIYKIVLERHDQH